MKKIFLISALLLATFIGICFAAGVLYTKEKITYFAETLNFELHYPYSDGKIEPVDLSNMLYTNIYTFVGKEGTAGVNTPDSYKNGWRTVVADNPEIAYEALSMFGQTFIDEYNGQLLKWKDMMESDTAAWKKPKKFITDTSYRNAFGEPLSDEDRNKLLARWKKDSAAIAMNLPTFSLENYWKEQRKVFDRYRSVAKKCLLLDDKTLNKYIISVGNTCEDKDDPNIEKFWKWLYDQKLIEKIPESAREPQGDGWYMWNYPCDLLLLTYRISHEYPKKWTPRKVLTEINKFAAATEKILPKYETKK